MLFMLQFENIRKLLEAAVRPKLREPFYTTTVCVNLVFAAFRYHWKHTYILPETMLLHRRHNSKNSTRTCPNRRRSG